MVVFRTWVHDGYVTGELVESGSNFTGIKITNDASISIVATAWLKNSKEVDVTITAGQSYTKNVPSTKLSNYIGTDFTTLYNVRPA